MDRGEKAAAVAELLRTFETVSAVVVTRNLGMTVAQSTRLRGAMRDAGAQYKVSKNTLALIALDGRLFSAALGQRLLVLLPIALAGVLVGHRVAHRFSTERLRLVIYSLLTASGLLLVLNALNRLF